MKLNLLAILVLFSVTIVAQTQKINIKGFGEVSVTKEKDYYKTDLGKFGTYNFSGSLDPLSLKTNLNLEQLKSFPGYNIYENLGLQDITLEVSRDGLALAATIDTRKNLGEVMQMYHINSPTMGVFVQLSKQGFVLNGELDFEKDPIVIDVIPDFSRYTLEKLALGAEWEAGGGKLAPVVGFSIQMRWKPTKWDPDIQSVTAFSYNLMTQEISASISMTDTWSNPLMLSEVLKKDAVVFSDVAASVDWPIGSPAPSGFGFNVGQAKFFDLVFETQMAITPTDKQVALRAYRNQISFNDLSRILRNGFGLNVPDVFPDDIYIKDAEILFSPNGGEVGEFKIKKGFLLRGKAKMLDALDAEVDFYASTDEGLHLYYKMDAAFRQYLEREFENHPKLKYISGQLYRTLEIHKIELHMEADKQLNMKGGTYCEMSILDKKISFEMKGEFSSEALKNKIIDEAMKIAGPEATAVINAVGKGVQEASKVAGTAVSLSSNLISKYAALAVVKKDHIHHALPHKSDNHCHKHCVPNRANEMTKDILPQSKSIIQGFHDRIIDDIVQIEGENDAVTKKLREQKFLTEWNNINKRLDDEWHKVLWDKGYVGFFYTPGNATKGGNYYRELVEKKKKEYIHLKNILYSNLLNARLASKKGFTKIENRWKGTYINIEKGPVQSTKIAMGWHSAMWKIEPVPGTEYVKLKNRWKETYLHIEHGKIESTKISPGWHSAQWKLERVPGTDYVKIQNRWKDTYLHLENGKLECSKIAQGWHSAMWKLHTKQYHAKAWNTKGEKNWNTGEIVLVSDNQKYKLIFEHDGNLKLLKYEILELWSSGTANRGANNLRFQHDGNLCIRTSPKNIIWASNSYGKNVEAIYLQDDGNLVMHAPGAKTIWATNTAQSNIRHNKFARIKNLWKNTYLNIEHGPVKCTEASPGWHSNMWMLEAVAGTNFVRIKNRWKNTYLHIEGGDKVQCTEIEPVWHSAMWEIEPIQGTSAMRIKNRWKNTYLNVEPGKIQCTDIKMGWTSAKWELEYVD